VPTEAEIAINVQWAAAEPASYEAEALQLAMKLAIVAGLQHRPEVGQGIQANVELNLLLTDDEQMRTLNRTFRGLDKPTDVLSFSQIEGRDARFVLPPSSVTMLGDVIISIDTAARQAAEQGHSLAYELRHLAVHGGLHLLGYDHETDEEEAEMNALAAVALGSGNPNG